MKELVRIAQFSFLFVSLFLKKYLLYLFSGFIIGVILSLIVFFLPAISLDFIEKENIKGVVGQYSLTSLPLNIQNQISFGLTAIDAHGEVKPGASSSFEILEGGKRFIFHLRRDLFWHDGKKFVSFDVNLRLKDVEIAALGDYELQFKLKEPYASLPSVTSQPLFRKGLTGLGENKVTKTTFAHGFISSLELINKNTQKKTIYKFYATSLLAIQALKLHKITTIVNLPNLAELSDWPGLVTTKKTDNEQFVALFYNTKKEPFSQKTVRLGLTYGVPEDLTSDREAFGPISNDSWVYNPQLKKFIYNEEQAKKYLKDLIQKDGTRSASLTLTTMPQYRPVADKIAQGWQDLGVKTKVQEKDSPEENFDVFLGGVRTFADPDQYFLWHSTQKGNITGLNSPRIDKLLEDGRRTFEPKERKQIYLDFQKFLVEEVPAAFLFYPTSYTVTRK